VDYCGSSEKFNVERLAAMIFRQLVSYTGNVSTPTVFSIPRSFTEPQLRAFRRASKIAGINLVGFIHDLSAAALVYAHTRVQHGSQREVVLFADMGQAFFQLQLVEFSENHFRVLSHHSEMLGGRDFTARLQKYLSDEIAAKYKVDVTKKPRNVWQMRKESLRLKKVLSTVPLVKFEYFIMDTDVSVQCTRAKFEDVCSDLLDRIQPAVQKVLSQGAEVLKASGSELNGGNQLFRISEMNQILIQSFQ
jgi:molecular chaperone DnaK (HSP70)